MSDEEEEYEDIHEMTPSEIAEHLWQLLDDISTAFDIYKPKMESFEIYVNRKCEERSKYLSSDGYNILWYDSSEYAEFQKRMENEKMPMEPEDEMDV